ncbi:enolase N-terminal-like fold-containing protein [[Eubacterium] cellulosolvens]
MVVPSGHVGLAHSLLSELMTKTGHLAGSSALELARLTLSWDTGSRVAEVARLNALSQLSLRHHANRILTSKGDIADHLTFRGDVVAVVGNMAPTARKLS